jgi:hypothetical protein
MIVVSAVYFISWYLLATLITMNVVVSFILDTFVKEWDKASLVLLHRCSAQLVLP